MKKKPALFAFVLILLVLSLFGCATGDKYFTYSLEGTETWDWSGNEFNWFWRSLPVKNSGEAENQSRNAEKKFEFFLENNTRIENGDFYIEREPYTLQMKLPVDDAKTITINKMNFIAKNNTIDLREKIDVEIGKEGALSEEEFVQLKKTGIIDLFGFESNLKIWKEICFTYNNVDVIFKRDKEFALEYDISIETQKGDLERYVFTAEYKRGIFTNDSRFADLF
jgi:hypothetical protein